VNSIPLSSFLSSLATSLGVKFPKFRWMVPMLHYIEEIVETVEKGLVFTVSIL